MSVLSFVSGDRFIVRVVKSLSTNPDNQWANSYEFRALDAGAEADLLTLGEALVDFEATMSINTTVFQRILISTWQPDSVPYDPTAFISSTLTASGGVLPPTDALALNQCLSVSRQAASGRFGHLFYRNWLKEGDVTAPAGKSVLVDRTALQSTLDGAITSSGLTDYLGGGSPGNLVMCMVNAEGTNMRTVNNLRVQGVSTIPQDHAWFNRTTPTP